MPTGIKKITIEAKLLTKKLNITSLSCEYLSYYLLKKIKRLEKMHKLLLKKRYMIITSIIFFNLISKFNLKKNLYFIN